MIAEIKNKNTTWSTQEVSLAASPKFHDCLKCFTP